MKQRKIPQRKCMGCNEMKDKKDLVRVVRTKIGENENGEEQYEVSLDLTGKKAGRGAYICRNIECLRKAGKSKRIEKSLEIKIPESVYESMEQELTEGE